MKMEHRKMNFRDKFLILRVFSVLLFMSLAGEAHAQQRFLIEGLVTGELYDTSSDSLLLTRNDGDLSTVGRLQLWSAYQLSDNWQIYALVELEADNASGSYDSEAELEQLAIRYTRPEAPYIVVEAGRILGPISVFSDWHLSDRNPLIGELDTHPTTYPEGIQVSGSQGKFDYRVAYIDQPDFYAEEDELAPDSAFRPVVGVGYTPIFGLRLGASWTEGPFLSSFYNDFLPEGVSWRDFDQRVVGLDFKFSHNYLELNGEWSRKEYQLPFLEPDLEELNWFIELKYTFTPRLFAAARLQVLDRSLIGTAAPEFTTAINRKLEDVEIGLGYRVNPDLLLKASYRTHHWSSPDNEANGLNDGHSLAFQLSWTLDPRSWRRHD
jgi:hypothetical protein